jgi:hypothetical protein
MKEAQRSRCCASQNRRGEMMAEVNVADDRDRIYRDRGRPSRARSANDARVHPTNDDRGSSMTRMVRLLALGPMMLDGLMKMMIRFGDSLLAIVVGAHTRCASEEQESRQRRTGQRYFPRAENSRLKFCLHPVLLYV